MKQIIEKIKSQMASSEKTGYADNQDSPYFLTTSEAQQIVEALEGMEARRAFALPKGEEVNEHLLNNEHHHSPEEAAGELYYETLKSKL